MDYRRAGQAQSPSPTCSIFSCFGPYKLKKDSFSQGSPRIGVEKRINVSERQLNLVEPMRITMYDPMPQSPMAAVTGPVARKASQTWKTVTRSSTRVDPAARKKRGRQLAQSDRPVRRHPSFRAIQLDVYEDKTFPDLLEFEKLDFDDAGSIREPPRALVRPQLWFAPESKELHSAVTEIHGRQSPEPHPTHSRTTTCSTTRTTVSRPESEYDALKSHPISWYTLPGLAPQVQMIEAPVGFRMSRIEEQFTPPPGSAVLINGKILAFPEVDASRTGLETPAPIYNPAEKRATLISAHRQQLSQSASVWIASAAASAKTVGSKVSQAPTHETMPEIQHTHAVMSMLELSNLSTHPSTREGSIKLSAPTFSEHRRRRLQLLNTSTQPHLNSASISPTSSQPKTPSPIVVYKPYPIGQAVHLNQPLPAPTQDYSTKSRVAPILHQRTHTRQATDSTIATVDTLQLFDEEFYDTNVPRVRDTDTESMTNYSDSAFNSRSSTLRSTTDEKLTQIRNRHSLYNHNMLMNQDYESDVDTPVKSGLYSTTVAAEIGRSVAKGFAVHGQSNKVYDEDRPLSTRTQVEDLEKYVHELCASQGIRRVNVGVAF